jgi:hypothetical protein
LQGLLAYSLLYSLRLSKKCLKFGTRTPYQEAGIASRSSSTSAGMTPGLEPFWQLIDANIRVNQD